jgi:hypothetical protein
MFQNLINLVGDKLYGMANVHLNDNQKNWTQNVSTYNLVAKRCNKKYQLGS